MLRGLQKVAKGVAIAATLLVAAWFAIVMRPFQQASDVLAPAKRPAPILLASKASTYRPVQNPGLIIPVKGVSFGELRDTFAEARASGARHHDAMDIMAPAGAPVVSAAAGRVEKLFVSGDGGNTVYVRSADGRRIFYYAHLAEYAPGLAEGQRLDRGSPIGSVGSTGNADPAAPHLHFAVWLTSPERGWWEAGTAINPYEMLRPAGLR